MPTGTEARTGNVIRRFLRRNQEGIDRLSAVNKLFNQAVRSGEFSAHQVSTLFDITGGRKITEAKFAICANPKLNADQMMALSMAFSAGLGVKSVEPFAKPEFSTQKMMAIQKGLVTINSDIDHIPASDEEKQGIKAEARAEALKYVSPDFSPKQVNEVMRNVSLANSPYGGLTHEDVEKISNPAFSPSVMRAMSDVFRDAVHYPSEYYGLDKNEIIAMAERGEDADDIRAYAYRSSILNLEENVDFLKEEIAGLEEKKEDKGLSEYDKEQLETYKTSLASCEKDIQDLRTTGQPVFERRAQKLNSKSKPSLAKAVEKNQEKIRQADKVKETKVRTQTKAKSSEMAM